MPPCERGKWRGISLNNNPPPFQGTSFIKEAIMDYLFNFFLRVARAQFVWVFLLLQRDIPLSFVVRLFEPVP